MENSTSQRLGGDLFSRYWSVLLALLVLLIAAGVTFTNINQALLEKYPFRQTQTALTSYWMIEEGWQLAYQTPVGGYPWMIPLEFPIYQSLTALLASLGNFNLDSTGRVVSFGFLLACFWPAFALRRRLGLNRETAWIFLALLWSCPLYMFWGRTFMIEIAAVFFTFSALPYALDLREPAPSWKAVSLFALFCTLGVLQKVTTTAPAMMVMGLLILHSHLKRNGLRLPSFKKCSAIVIAFLIPTILLLLWTQYSDHIKEQNVLGAQLTSEALGQWNFGTLHQRFDPGVLKSIFHDRIMTRNNGGIFGALLIVGALLFGNAQVKTFVGICLVLFILPIFMFINLHWRHTYYQTASTIFLVGALTLSVTAWLPDIVKKNSRLPKIIKRCLSVKVVTLILVLSNLLYFIDEYKSAVKATFNPSTSTVLAISDVIRRYTPEQSAFVAFGYGWNSAITYYAQRKSFSVPTWLKRYDDVWDNPGHFIGNKPLGAVVFCPFGGDGLNLKKIASHTTVKTGKNLFKVKDSFIWLPGVDSIQLPAGGESVLPVQLPQESPEEISGSLPE